MKAQVLGKKTLMNMMISKFDSISQGFQWEDEDERSAIQVQKSFQNISLF